MFRKSLLVLALFAVSAFSYSYTIFAPMTGAGSFALNPVIYVDDRNSGGTEIFMYYGLADKLDFCSSISTTNGMGNFSAMLRYDFGGAKILGLRVNPSWISPHFNINFENDRVYFQATAATQITYDYAKKPAVFGILCPGLKLNKYIDIFCYLGFSFFGMWTNIGSRLRDLGINNTQSLSTTNA